VNAIRNHLGEHKSADRAAAESDREVIEQHLERVIIKRQAIEIYPINEAEATADAADQGTARRLSISGELAFAITLPWTMTDTVTAKGVIHSPSSNQAAHAEERDALLTAIAKARAWINDLVEGRVASFAEIAKREGKVERHIRLLAPLAFVSPKIVANILNGDTHSHGVTEFAKRLTYCWSRQAPNRPLV
jgi:site-specific DNA recombinase